MANAESKQTSRITVGEIKLNFNGVEDERRRGVDSILGDVKLKKKSLQLEEQTAIRTDTFTRTGAHAPNHARTHLHTYPRTHTHTRAHTLSRANH